MSLKVRHHVSRGPWELTCACVGAGLQEVRRVGGGAGVHSVVLSDRQEERRAVTCDAPAGARRPASFRYIINWHRAAIHWSTSIDHNTNTHSLVIACRISLHLRHMIEASKVQIQIPLQNKPVQNCDLSWSKMKFSILFPITRARIMVQCNITRNVVMWLLYKV